MTINAIGELFPILMLAHAIGDFPLQTNFVFLYKVTRPWGVFLHVSIIGVCMVILLIPYLYSPGVLGLLLLLLASHVIQDKLKIEKQRDESRNNMWSFISDQLLHILFIVLMSLVAKSLELVRTWPLAVPEDVERFYQTPRAMWIATWYILGTYGGRILLGYLRKSFSASHEFSLDEMLRKYGGFFERAGIATGVWMGALIHPGYGLIAVAAVLPGIAAYRMGKITFQDFGFSAGLGVVTGLVILLT